MSLDIAEWREYARDAEDEIRALTIERGRLRAELAEAKRDADMRRAERDSILLDAAAFFGWFNRHYAEPSNHPDHEWNMLGMRLSAYPCVAEISAAMAGGAE